MPCSAGVGQTWTAELPSGPVRLAVETVVLPVDLRRGQLGGEQIRLVAGVGDQRAVLAELDGRYWSYETAMAFTGRVVGVYAERGVVHFHEIGYEGRASAPPPDASLST